LSFKFCYGSKRELYFLIRFSYTKTFGLVGSIMGKTRVSVRAKLYNLSLTLKDAATVQNSIAAASSALVFSASSVINSGEANVDVADLKATGPLQSVAGEA
jgi:hypothetical protein